MEFLRWIEKSWLGAYIRESEWGYPIVLCAHAVGMAIVVGCVFVVCLRSLGYARGLALDRLKLLTQVAWIGFGINAVSGVLLFTGNARKLAIDISFQLKIFFLIVGGYMVWLLWRTLAGEPETMSADGVVSLRSRQIAAATFVVWLAVIIAGRTIAYTISQEYLP